MLESGTKFGKAGFLESGLLLHTHQSGNSEFNHGQYCRPMNNPMYCAMHQRDTYSMSALLVSPAKEELLCMCWHAVRLT